MPTSEGTLYGFKYVNGHPKNTKEGRQTVTAFGVLSDVGNGYLMLLSDAKLDKTVKLLVLVGGAPALARQMRTLKN